MSENPEPLRDRRKKIGLTQQQLADLAGVKLSMIADIESERQRPSDETARLIDEALKEAESEFKQKSMKDIFILARIEAGLSQEDVAKGAGIDLLKYSRWEADRDYKMEAHLTNEELFRLHDVIDGAVPAPRPTGKLSDLAVLGSFVERVAIREEKKEADRIVDVIEERQFQEEMANASPAHQAAVYKQMYEVVTETVALQKKTIAHMERTIQAQEREIETLRKQLE